MGRFGRWLAGSRARLAILIAVTIFGVAAPAASAKNLIFWTNPNASNQIFYANLDGSSTSFSHVNLTGATDSQPWGLGLDPADGKIFWSDYAGNKISYANLDGSGGGDLRTGGATVSNPLGVVVDKANGKIYWANYSGGGTGKISWAKLDNSNVGGDLSTGMATVVGPLGVAIEPSQNRIYWANYAAAPSKISFASLSDNNVGNDLTITGTTPNQSWGVTIDPGLNRIFWGNFGTDTLDSADLTGNGGAPLNTTGTTTLGPFPGSIDPNAGRIYWANWNSTTLNVANDDGSGHGRVLYDTGMTEPAMPVLLETPVGSGAPTITGGPGVPTTLHCSQGGWTPDHVDSLDYDAPQKFSYSWFLNGSQITAATGDSLNATAGGSYTCRVTATNFAGFSSQTSAAFPVAGPPAVSATANTSGLTAIVTVSCHGASNQSCSGQVILTAHAKKKGGTIIGVSAAKHRHKRKSKRVEITVGSGSYSLGAGSSVKLQIPLNKTGRKLLGQFFKLPTTVSLPGTSASSTLTFRIKRIKVNHHLLVWKITVGHFTSAFSLVLKPVPKGATVKVGCHGGGCPFGQRKVKAKKSSVSVTKVFGASKLRPGTRVTFAITAAQHVGQLLTYVLLARPTIPTPTVKCIPPGSKRAVKC